MAWLDHPAITREKAGILRPGGTMITLPQHPEANQVLGEVATELGVRGVSATPYVPGAGVVGSYSIEALGAETLIDSPLAGAHQHRNLALAVAARRRAGKQSRILYYACSHCRGKFGRHIAGPAGAHRKRWCAMDSGCRA